MKKVQIYFLLFFAMLFSHQSIFAQQWTSVYSEGFDYPFGTQFISGAIPNWIATHGTPRVTNQTHSGIGAAEMDIMWNNITCGNMVAGEGIALNFNFKQGKKYKIVCWGLEDAFDQKWILTSGMPNTTGTPLGICINKARYAIPNAPAPNVPLSKQTFPPSLIFKKHESITQYLTQDFTQLYLYAINPPNSNGGVNANHTTILIDDIEIFEECSDPISTFHFEDINGIAKTDFCIGEDIFLNGTASSNETAYEIVLSERLIADGPWAPFVWPNGVPLVLPWVDPAQIGIVNLTQLIKQLITNTGRQFCFSNLKEYQIGLRLANACGGYTETNHQFKWLCCPGVIKADFNLGDVPLPNGSFLLSAFNQFSNPSAICMEHEWLVYRSPNGNAPYEYMGKVTGPVFQNYPTLSTFCYLVIHRIKVGDCTFCYGAQKCNNNGLAQGGPCTFCGPLANCQLPLATPSVFSCGIYPNGNKFITWNQVEGAMGYQIEFKTNDVVCCNNMLPSSTFTMNSNTNSYVLPYALFTKCFSWRVRTIFANGSSVYSGKQCWTTTNLACSGPQREEADFTNGAAISLYPNPVTDNNLTISVASTDDATQTEIQIFSIDGRMLLSTTTTGSKEETIDVSKLSSGMYIVKAIQNGQQVYTTKFQKL